MSLVELIVVKIKQEGLPRRQKDLPERINYLPITSAMPSAILSAISPIMLAIT